MVRSLDVYKASAGSGKTFRLTLDYLSYLIGNPESFRHILAVTFTNRATEEMKRRILSGLYGIAHGLPDARGYVERLCGVSPTGEKLDEQLVAERASTALFNLLHHYNDFRIETIDSFFQRVFRNLARELNLTANLRIDLNDKQVEQQAVDQLIEELDGKDEVLTWLMDFISENIDEDKNWNVIGQVKSFGENIFKDFYKENSERLLAINEKGVFDAIKKQLMIVRNQAKDEMVSIGNAFFEDLESHGIEEGDLWQKSGGPVSYFKKLRNGHFNSDIFNKRAATVYDDYRQWAPKGSAKSALIIERAEKVWHPLMEKAENMRTTQYKLYQSANLTLRHLNQLRLLGHIERRVNQLNEEANRFLLSNTQSLLSRLIQDQDSPFIFEKIGSRLKHIMIDEFQDTSTIQWKNFKILLTECMSHGNKNLIVGDVKQSIYRWRSGDWRLLNDIEAEFPHGQDQFEIKHLDTNYRSDRKVITFNNAFFEQAVMLEERKLEEEGVTGSEMYRRAYADVCQQLPKWKENTDKGYVHIELLPKEDYRKNVLEKLIETVKTLVVEKGVRSNDIAILVRVNRDIPTIANHFMENMPEVKIVSDEAFKLNASVAVNMLIDALKVLNTPEDHLTMAQLAKCYQKEILQNHLSDSALFAEGRPVTELLPEAFNEEYTRLTGMPLFDLVERLYHIFHLDRLSGQSTYIATLYDILGDYLRERTPDINMFLKDWENVFSEMTIQGDEIDGIRLISIHKSKGLEFPHVIIPFCDWQLEQQGTIWCVPGEAPFNALPIVPIPYSSKQLLGTIYEKDYWQEHLQNTVDNMNLLYVAFTRARKSLIAFGKRDNNQSRSQIIQEVLPKIAEQLGDRATLEDEGNETNIVFTYGTLEKSEERQNEMQKHASQNTFLTMPTPLRITIKSYETQAEFRQSNLSQKFIMGEPDAHQESYIKAGNVLHQIFSQIHTIDDIAIMLEQLRRDGILYQKDVSEAKIKGMLNKIIANKRIAEWFSPKWQVFNECTILTKDEQGALVQYRPDRVMTDGDETVVIDFKFGKPREEYQSQVRQYMQLLTDMGYQKISGFLWFVYKNEIQEVQLT